MSLYDPGEPNAINEYRDRTHRRNTAPGISVIPKMAFCICCEKNRTYATGTETAKGFVCGMCKPKKRKKP